MCHPEVPAGAVTPVVAQAEIAVPLATGEQMPCLLATPEAGRAPAVLIIPDVFGRSPFYEHLAARLATAGFTAVLADFFFRQGPLPERAIELARARRAALDERQALRDLADVIDWLKTQPTVVSDRVGTIGFCMGGTFVLDLAAMRRDLVSVCYYGFPALAPGATDKTAPAPLSLVDTMTGPIFGLWGDQDAGVGMANVEQLRAELERRGVAYRQIIYPGLGHGFLSQSGLDPDHPAYQLACDAWTRTLDFYRDHLLAPVA